MTEDHQAQPVRQDPNHIQKPGRTHAHTSHDRHHAFANPVELAKKWNDPERDKWQSPEEIVASLELKPGATVADIGAGTGYMVAHLSQAVDKDGTVIAMDASAAMIEYLAAHANDLGPAAVNPKGDRRPVSADVHFAGNGTGPSTARYISDGKST